MENVRRTAEIAFSAATLFYARNNPVQWFPSQKSFHTTVLKALKEQFSKMEDAGDIEPPESSSSTPTTARHI